MADAHAETEPEELLLAVGGTNVGVRVGSVKVAGAEKESATDGRELSLPQGDAFDAKKLPMKLDEADAVEMEETHAEPEPEELLLAVGGSNVGVRVGSVKVAGAEKESATDGRELPLPQGGAFDAKKLPTKLDMAEAVEVPEANALLGLEAHAEQVGGGALQVGGGGEGAQDDAARALEGS